MQGIKRCRVAVRAARSLGQRHTAKFIMRLTHCSLRSARRWLANGWIPARVAAWALPLFDAAIERKVSELEAIHLEIERAEADLGLRPVCLAPAHHPHPAPAPALHLAAPED